MVKYNQKMHEDWIRDCLLSKKENKLPEVGRVTPTEFNWIFKAKGNSKQKLLIHYRDDEMVLTVSLYNKTSRTGWEETFIDKNSLDKLKKFDSKLILALRELYAARKINLKKIMSVCHIFNNLKSDLSELEEIDKVDQNNLNSEYDKKYNQDIIEFQDDVNDEKEITKESKLILFGNLKRDNSKITPIQKRGIAEYFYSSNKEGILNKDLKGNYYISDVCNNFTVLFTSKKLAKQAASDIAFLIKKNAFPVNIKGLKPKKINCRLIY